LRSLQTTQAKVILGRTSELLLATGVPQLSVLRVCAAREGQPSNSAISRKRDRECCGAVCCWLVLAAE
jgi:hypothetical protein